MHADSHFMIGYSHTKGGKPCQDYATSGNFSDLCAYAVLSDGCSSGAETDIGARILTQATVKALRYYYKSGTIRRTEPYGAIRFHQDTVLETAKPLLGCDDMDLLATSICAFYEPQQGGFAYLQGDGVVAWETANNLLRMQRYEWLPHVVNEEAREASPFYPAYRTMAGGWQGFVTHYGGNSAAKVFQQETWVDLEDAEPYNNTKSWELGTAMRGIPIMLPPGLRYVAIFSDGVTQVEGIDWKDAVRELMSFKTTPGLFVKRRMTRFVLESQRRGHGPLDDISYAVIHDEGGEER